MTEKNTSTRLANLDNVKWILTLLIVLYHIQYLDDGENGKKLFFFIKNLGDCVVPAFALISGFLFWKDIDSLDKVKMKIQRRIWTLGVPYLLWNFVNTLYLNLKNVRALEMSVFNINIIHDLLQCNSSPHFWYVFMLIFWTILAPVLYYVYRDKCLL